LLDEFPRRSVGTIKVKQASAHWLRHSYGSFLANDCQIPLAYIRDELGHASISTTSIYLNADDKKRQQAVSAAFVMNTPVQDS
jgi:integrase/recombinase XerD